MRQKRAKKMKMWITALAVAAVVFVALVVGLTMVTRRRRVSVDKLGKLVWQ